MGNKIAVRLVVLLAMGLCSAANALPLEVNLIPWPHELQVNDTSLELTDRSRIVYAGDQFRPLANVLHHELIQTTGLNLLPDAGPARQGDILVMAWETAYQLPQSLLDNGYNIVNVSWKPSYLTPGWRWDPEYIYHWNMFRWENHWKAAPSYVPIQLDPYPSDRIVGGMMCSWESPDEMEIPGIRLRLAPLSERIWSPDLNLPYDHFFRRFTHTDQVLQTLIRPVAVHAKGLTDPDYIGPFYNRENHFGREITVTMQPLVSGACIRYTLDGTVPTQASPLYDKPLTLRETTTLRTQVYDADGDRLGFIATIPYEHHPITGQVDGLLMQVRHDNGRGRYRTQFGREVTVTLQCLINLMMFERS